MATQDLTLELNKQPRICNRVDMRKGDFGSLVLNVTVLHNGNPALIAGKKARFECRRRDGTKIIEEEFTLTSNVFEYSIPASVGSIQGLIKIAYFAIFDGDVWRDTTEAFFLNVQESVMTGIAKSDYIADIDKALALVNSYASMAGDSETHRVESEDMRIVHEAARIAAEIERTSAEAARATGEAERIAAETERMHAEEARIANENGRTVAEESRAEAEAKRIADFAEMEQRSKGWLRYYCSEDEYDPVSRKPIIGNPDTGTMYLVPVERPTADNRSYEWYWSTVYGDWEKFVTSGDGIAPISTDTIDSVVSGGMPVGGEVLNTTGLSYFYTSIYARWGDSLAESELQAIWGGFIPEPDRIDTISEESLQMIWTSTIGA